MLKRTTKTGLASILAAGSLVAYGTTGSPAAPQLNHLKGVWEIHGSSMSPGAPPPFVNTALFSHDGEIINLTPDGGTSVGTVERSGPGTYTTRFFGYDSSNGLAEFEVEGTFRLTGPDTFAGTFTTTLRDLNGTVLGSYDGLVDANRK